MELYNIRTMWVRTYQSEIVCASAHTRQRLVGQDPSKKKIKLDLKIYDKDAKIIVSKEVNLLKGH